MKKISLCFSLLLISGCASNPHLRDVELHAKLDMMYEEYPDISVIEQLLQQGARANSLDAQGRTTIWKAMDRNRVGAIELLLAYGADPDSIDVSPELNRGTPLCYLIGLNRYNSIPDRGLDLMRTFLRAGASPSQICPNDESALALALSINNGRSLRVLADAGVRVGDALKLRAASLALANAADRGDDVAVSALIALGADVNRKLPERPLPLEIALVNNRNASTAFLLLQAGAKPVRQDIVVMAVERIDGDPQLIAALLAAGANPNEPDIHRRTPLFFAVRRGYVETLQVLLEAGADPNNSGTGHPHPLHLAFDLPMASRVSVAKPLVKAGADLEAKNRDDRTALMRAAWTKDFEYARFLQESGADIHATNRWGTTAADLAASSGADLVLLDLLGQTAAEKRLNIGERLNYVVMGQKVEEMRELVAAGVDLNARGKDDRCALEAAGRGKDGDMFQALLDGGANPNVFVLDGSPLQGANAGSATLTITRRRQLGAQDDPSIPLLTSAVLAANIDMIPRLLNAGANPNGLSASGDTALHLASFALVRVDQAIGLLLQAGADPALANSAGFTPLTLAAKHRAIEFVHVLLDHGADVNAPDQAGRTALGESLQYGAVFNYVQELIDRGARPSDADLARARKTGSRTLIEIVVNGVAK